MSVLLVVVATVFYALDLLGASSATWLVVWIVVDASATLASLAVLAEALYKYDSGRKAVPQAATSCVLHRGDGTHVAGGETERLSASVDADDLDSKNEPWCEGARV